VGLKICLYASLNIYTHENEECFLCQACSTTSTCVLKMWYG